MLRWWLFCSFSLGQERLCSFCFLRFTARYGERARVSNLEQAPGYRTSEGLEVALAEGSLVRVLRRNREDPVAEGPARRRALTGRRTLVVWQVAPRTAGRLAAEGAP